MPEQITWLQILAESGHPNSIGTTDSISLSDAEVGDPALFLANLLDAAYKAQEKVNAEFINEIPITTFHEPVSGTPAYNSEKGYYVVGTSFTLARLRKLIPG